LACWTAYWRSARSSVSVVGQIATKKPGKPPPNGKSWVGELDERIMALIIDPMSGHRWFNLSSTIKFTEKSRQAPTFAALILVAAPAA